MGSLLFQGAFATGLDENEAQSTVEPIRTDNDSAELRDPPEWNTVESDDSGQLIGLSPRVVQSDTVHNQEQSGHTQQDIADYETAPAGNNQRDMSWASNGTAAAREEAGQFGHGPILEVIGIEPLNPAQRYGNDYFKVPDIGANELAGEYMEPAIGAGNWTQAVAQAQANQNARAAFRSTQYANFFGQTDAAKQVK